MIRNVVVISDTHFGCQLALCPPEVTFDNGGTYKASRLQRKLWDMWTEFWEDFVPKATRGENYVIVHNGDVVDGVHHNSTTQISHNLEDQRRIAIETLLPRVSHKNCKGYFHIRGTEAHVGKSAQEEESIAKALGAVKDEIGNGSRWELLLSIGAKKSLIHFTHHVGTTSSAAYESTGAYKEMIEGYTEAGRYKLTPPDVWVRSHRHRNIQIEIPASDRGNAIVVVTPGWQLKTPFAYRISLGRSARPQVGGIVIREGEEVPIYVRNCVWSIENPKTERID